MGISATSILRTAKIRKVFMREQLWATLKSCGSSWVKHRAQMAETSHPKLVKKVMAVSDFL